jgi:hypothetical protein
LKQWSEKAMKSNKKSVELSKTIEMLHQNIADLENKLEEKNIELNVKTDRIKMLSAPAKNQRDKSN